MVTPSCFGGMGPPGGGGGGAPVTAGPRHRLTLKIGRQRLQERENAKYPSLASQVARIFSMCLQTLHQE